jgi:hypothetical protein
MRKTNAYKILVRYSEKKRAIGRPACRWEDNIKLDLRDIMWKVVDGTHLFQDRNKWGALVTTGTNF